MPHTDAVVAAISAIPMLVGRTIKPAGGGWTGTPGSSTYVRYAVVYPSPGSPDGNLAEPYEYLDYSAQVNIFGATASQAEGAMDAVRSALIGQRLTVVGRATYPVQFVGGPPVIRDDSVTPAVFMAAVEIAFLTQPL
jgi:hypothetical protein